MSHFLSARPVRVKRTVSLLPRVAVATTDTETFHFGGSFVVCASRQVVPQTKAAAARRLVESAPENPVTVGPFFEFMFDGMVESSRISSTLSFGNTYAKSSPRSFRGEFSLEQNARWRVKGHVPGSFRINPRVLFGFIIKNHRSALCGTNIVQEYEMSLSIEFLGIDTILRHHKSNPVYLKARFLFDLATKRFLR